MTDVTTDVLILGAGPVGLTLANELARRDVKTLIVDKAHSIREVSKALILHVRTQEALSRVGILEKARAEAQPLTEVVVNAYGKFVGSWDLDDIDSPYPHPLILGQHRTQHLLLDQLSERGIKVAWNTEAVALRADTDYPVTTLKGPESGEQSLVSRFVVGCEGSNSLVRKNSRLHFRGRTLHRRAIHSGRLSDPLGTPFRSLIPVPDGRRLLDGDRDAGWARTDLHLSSR